MEKDSLVQTILQMGRVSHRLHEWWVPPTTNTDTPMPDFNKLEMDSAKRFSIKVKICMTMRTQNVIEMQ
jgi:hypothetical protein